LGDLFQGLSYHWFNFFNCLQGHGNDHCITLFDISHPFDFILNRTQLKFDEQLPARLHVHNKTKNQCNFVFNKGMAAVERCGGNDHCSNFAGSCPLKKTSHSYTPDLRSDDFSKKMSVQILRKRYSHVFMSYLL
jgi:hypothetical protein